MQNEDAGGELEIGTRHGATVGLKSQRGGQYLFMTGKAYDPGLFRRTSC